MKKTTLLLFFFILSAKAQSVGGYLFNQSTEVYSPVVGNNSTAAGDDGTQDLIPIGFNFSYGGAVYTTYSISTNGYIRLGNPIAAQSWINVLSATSTQSPLIAAFWDDHNRTTGSIQYVVSGTSPNKVLEIGWDAISLGNNGVVSGTGNGSFKMRLQETTGIIEFVYGPTMNPAGALSASIGLNDLTTFLSVSPTNAIATASNAVANNAIGITQNLLGQKFVFTPEPQCSGTPDPGNTISSVSSVCANFPFSLSLQNQVGGFGNSYQWQSSTTGSNFVDIPNANSSTLPITQVTGTFYRCIVSCGAAEGISSAVEVTMNPFGECFCFPTYTNGKTDGDLISNVVCAGTTLANNTGTAPVNPSYTYFSGQAIFTAIFQTGYSYDLSVTVGAYQQQNVAVWIDYNDDTIFSTNERVGYSSAEIGSNETGVFPINIDCSASVGVHRMRVRDVWNTPADTIDPCANYGYGETEDYDVTIEAPSGCQAPYALTTGAINSSSAELLWTSGCNQSTWDVQFTLAGGGVPGDIPSNPNVASPLFVTGLSPLTSYDFYVRAICSDTMTSEWAGPFNFTTLPVEVGNDDCETAIALTAGTTFEEHAVIGTNVGATKTIGAPNPTCAIFGFGGDVWYSVVVPPDGKVTLEVRQDPGSTFVDSGLTAFSGSCGSLTTIACSDDEGIGGFSLLNLTGLTPGDTIYARIWEYGNDSFGTFQFSAYSTTLSSSNFEKVNLKLYPNPVKNILNISHEKNISSVVVLNVLGQEVMRRPTNATEVQIDMSRLSVGTYFIKIGSDNQVKTIKVIKE